MARLLQAYRGVRKNYHLPPLTEEQILHWARAWHERTGRWPTYWSGKVPGSGGETWRGIGGGALTGQLACAAAAFCYGLGFPYTRRFLSSRPEGGVALSAMQLVCATAMLALFIPLSRGPTLHLSWQAVGSLLALGILGSGVAYALNFAIVRAKGAGVASTVTYLIPVFATILGVAVLGEPVEWNQPVGTSLLLAGIAMSQGRLRLPGPVAVAVRSGGGGVR